VEDEVYLLGGVSGPTVAFTNVLSAVKIVGGQLVVEELKVTGKPPVEEQNGPREARRGQVIKRGRGEEGNTTEGREGREEGLKFNSGTPPSPRSSHALIAVGQKLISCCGGNYYEEFYNDTHVLDLRTKEWTKIDTKGDHPIPNWGATVTLYNRELYYFGGVDSNFETWLNDIFVLNV
jgi:hypothetical protein